jgi:glycosyltransferase involved in cell wall biosynthesis
MKITFGIATYNNITNLILTLNSIQIAMKSFRKFKYEIIIIDDNSLDKTEEK